VRPLGITTCGIASVTTSRFGLSEDLDARLAPAVEVQRASSTTRPWCCCWQRSLGSSFVHPSGGSDERQKQRRVICLLAVAAIVVVALAACGTTTTTTRASSGSATKSKASCESAYVDWLYLSAVVTCGVARRVASAIFMGDDGNERTSFMKEDFSPLPTVKVAGVGYLPTRILGFWQCRYGTRRASYGVQTGMTWFDPNGSLRLVYATCRLDAGVVKMTTAIDQRANRRDS
jgi:hypothetical protein